VQKIGLLIEFAYFLVKLNSNLFGRCAQGFNALSKRNNSDNLHIFDDFYRGYQELVLLLIFYQNGIKDSIHKVFENHCRHPLDLALQRLGNQSIKVSILGNVSVAVV
jgi:hypothetical protein